MADIEWQPLPSPMWPDPAVWTYAGDFELLVFTLHGVPTWEVRHKATSDSIRRDDLVAAGTADTFEAAKAAAKQARDPQNENTPHRTRVVRADCERCGWSCAGNRLLRVRLTEFALSLT